MGEISNGVSFEFVGMITGPLIAVWLVALGVLSLGIQKGISKSSDILMPAFSKVSRTVLNSSGAVITS